MTPVEILQLQKNAFSRSRPGIEKRKETLKKLSKLVEDHKQELIDAVSRDFGYRVPEETLILEIFPIQDQIRHALKNLKTWMKRERVSSTWFLKPSKAFYEYQALGVAGIMGTWNYQIMLSLSPLVDAIAAGNHAMIKPSEVAPQSAEVIKKMINTAFDVEYIHCITGGAEVAQNFSALPFDHLFFTGSTNIGKKVMAAAAPNLTPVTLELGGKSPGMIHHSYDLDLAVKRIFAGKLFNAGQTCVATDYVIVSEKRNDDLIEAAKKYTSELYPDISNFTTIVNNKHFERLSSWLKDAQDKGAKIIELATGKNDRDRLLTPKLVLNVSDDMKLMQEEIFGPIMPVVNLESLEDMIEYVNERPKPLALYYFDSSSKRRDLMLKKTLSGGVTFNDTLYHLAQHNLPFGGVGNSGMGHYHGFDGFKTFSKKRAVMVQRKIAASDYLLPPYSGYKKKLLNFMSKFSKS